MTNPQHDTAQDLERALLGAMLWDPQLAKISRLEPTHWSRERHALCYEALRGGEWEVGLREVNGTAFVYWIAEEPRLQLLSKCGGLAYVTRHMEHAISTQNPEYYETAILERYKRRRLVEMANTVADQQRTGVDVSAIVSDTRREIDRIDRDGDGSATGPSRGSEELLEDVGAESRGESVSFLRTGMEIWDRKWLGLPSEGMILMLARSGMGKTSLLNSLGVSLAGHGHRVLLHGTETSSRSRNRVITFGMSGVDPRAWGRLTVKKAEEGLSPREEETLSSYHARLIAGAHDRSQLPLYITGSGMTVERLAAEIRREHHRGLSVAVVDYVQNFPRSKAKGLGSDKTEQVMHCSSVITELSAELHIPIIVAAQVSGEKAGLPAKGAVIPQMWDAQWASSLHQDAEEVHAINRGDYWEQRLDEDRSGAGFDENFWGSRETMSVTARKRRMGPPGEAIDLGWYGPLRWVGPLWDVLPAPMVDRTRSQPASWHDPREND